MPETAMDKHHFFKPREYNIGFSGQTLVMNPVSVSSVPEDLSQFYLRFCVPVPNPGHIETALFRCVNIHNKSGELVVPKSVKMVGCLRLEIE